jgi:hypothetical protein
MPADLQKIATPQWMLDVFKAIDTLDYSPSSGFSAFDENIYMNFNGQNVQGKENVKAFFAKLDTPFVTKHYVTTVWQTGKSYVAQGGATVRKREDSEEKTLHIDEGYNVFWMNAAGKVSAYIVTLPPGKGSQLGVGN